MDAVDRPGGVCRSALHVGRREGVPGGTSEMNAASLSSVCVTLSNSAPQATRVRRLVIGRYMESSSRHRSRQKEVSVAQFFVSEGRCQFCHFSSCSVQRLIESFSAFNYGT